MHIVVLNWRDTANPEGGGSEVYVEQIAHRWARHGHRVTVVCAAHGRAPSLEDVEGIRFVRVGGKLTVYSAARRLLRRGALGRVDVIVDTHNGIPFFALWASSAPTVVLVHHMHREQWPVVYDSVRARIGWWIESSLAPWAYRGHPYVTVSEATRDELIDHGVPAECITIVHNGTQQLAPCSVERDPSPRILVLGRLVPHKRVEHVITAARGLSATHPGLTVSIVGDGWWGPELRAHAELQGVADIVEFHGYVDEEEKSRQIARAWVLALPSLKEGWGLVVMEAASRGVPSVAYADAGGVTESIIHEQTGLLVDGDEAAFAEALDLLITDESRRQSMGSQARQHARDFSWDASARNFEEVLTRAVGSPQRSGAPSASWWPRRRRRADRR